MKKILFILLLLFTCCTHRVQQSKNYYFPIAKFLSEQTYCFENQNNKIEKYYWKMQTFISNNDTVLKTTIHNNEQRITNVMTEKLQRNKADMLSFTLYGYTPEGNKQVAECEILETAVFNFNQKVGDKIRWKVRFKYSDSPATYELTKIRTLKSETSTQQTFLDELSMNMLDTGESYNYSVISIYQKGKGLISYKLFVPDREIEDFILVENK